jgi:hypothetical protein
VCVWGEYVGDSPLIHKMPCHSLAKHVHLGRKQKKGKKHGVRVFWGRRP